MQFPSLASPIVYWITYSFINTVRASILLGLCFSSLYSLWCLALFSSSVVAKWLISKTNLFHISSGNFSNLSTKNLFLVLVISILCSESYYTPIHIALQKNVTSGPDSPQNIKRVFDWDDEKVLQIVLMVAQHCDCT